METSSATAASSGQIKSFNSLSANSKYNGLIPIPFTKRVKKSLLSLFEYIATITPPMYGLHTFITWWRMLQLIGPTFLASFHDLWGKDSIMDKFLGYFSILYTILPTIVRPEGCPYYALAYGIIMFLYFILITVCAYQFTKYQKLPQWIAITISAFTSTFGYVATNAYVSLGGELFGYMVQYPDIYANSLNIASFTIGGLAVIVWDYILSEIYLASITFKADSLQSIYPTTSIFIANITYLTSFLLAIVGPILIDPIKKTLGVLTIVIFFLSTFALFNKGGFVSTRVQKLTTSILISGTINLIIFMILESQKIHPKEYMIIIYALIIILSYFVLSIIINKIFNRSLLVLDRILEDESYFDEIKTARKFVTHVVIGYRYAHPICLNFSAFKMATRKWPEDHTIWVLFARFTAIFPEINQQLYYISVGVQNNKIKNNLAKQCLQQIFFIMSQREGNLVPSLKAKLDRLNKTIQQTKHKIRYMWDLVIQGNESELEGAIGRVQDSVEVVDAEFLQILRQYPNNRFVARAYARYLRDVTADYKEYKKWTQNCALLSRGIKVNSDIAHDLGVKAFPSLPPTITSGEYPDAVQINDESTVESFEMSVDDNNEAMTNDMETRLIIKESINSLTIPGYFCMKFLTILNLVLFFAVPLVAFIIYSSFYLDEIKPPLNFLFTTSTIGTRLSQLLSFTHRFIIETINVTGPSGEKIFPVPDYTHVIRMGLDAPASIGGSWETIDQVVYIMCELVVLQEGLKEVMDFHTSDPNMQRVINGIYGEVINFTYYSDPKYIPDAINPTSVEFNTTYKMVNLLQASTEFILKGLDLTKMIPLTPLEYNSKAIRQGFSSIKEIQDAVDDISEHMVVYIRNYKKNIDYVTEICMIVIPIFIFLAHLIFLVIIAMLVHRDKHLIYKSIISLPKNVVSKVTDSFKILKKESELESHSKSHDEDYNRQEENMLKIFATTGNKGKGFASDLSSTLACTILQIIVHIAAAIILCMMMRTLIRMIYQAAPHISYITGSYSADISCLAFVSSILGYKHNTNLYQLPFTEEEVFGKVDYYTSRLSSFFQAIRYGNPATGDVPFASLGIKLEEATNAGHCSDDVFPTKPSEIYSCSNADALLSYCQVVDRLVKNVVQYGHSTFEPDDHLHMFVWHIHLYHVFNDYFYPMFQNVMSECYRALDEEYPIYIGAAIGLLAFQIILEIIYYILALSSESRQYYGLSLLLHCPGSAVISNQNIVQILAGNFSQSSVDTTTRDADFYDIVIKDLPDSIMILNVTGAITQSNKATETIYGIKNSDIIGQTAAEFGKKIFGSENPFEVLETGEKKAIFMRADNTAHLEISINVQQDCTLISTRDITQTVMYNQLISDERKKSDQLLSSILPASLVSRVQAGEKNISFAIQTVTILFMDIVSFTPWCGSLPASKVMKTLNSLFKEFDAAVARHSTVTKIKCIGDCYMAAGGIFAEINQPAIHAKDTVDFGLDALDAIERVNEEIGEKLAMRVGINTGGPIVAGVLGTAKPTFEIIGPAINMAQQMEHHGVPKRVHISRSVYELIYGSNYIIKERGEIEIKNGKVITYIVEGRKTS